MDLRLGFLCSHNGSNVKSIINKIESGKLNALPKTIIGNNPDACVLEIGKSLGIPTYCINGKNSLNVGESILENLLNNDVDLVVLAGYMKKIDECILEYYHNRIINIHPSLLPKYGGKGMYGINVHKSVISSGEKESGATVHIVDGEYDHGKILSQCKTSVYEYDTPETLSKRVLEIEHYLYPKTLIDIQEEKINLDSNR